MSESKIQFNGDTKVILSEIAHLKTDINEVKTELKTVKKDVRAISDFQLSHPLCPTPGTCIDLKNEIKDVRKIQTDCFAKLDSTRKFVWMGVGIMVVIALASRILGPILINHIL